MTAGLADGFGSSGGGPVELQHDSVLEDRLDVIGVDETVLLAEEVLADHDPVKDVLILGRQHMADLPDLLLVGAVDRGSLRHDLVGNRLAKIHRAGAYTSARGSEQRMRY